jgi:hypothetical protein
VKAEAIESVSQVSPGETSAGKAQCQSFVVTMISGVEYIISANQKYTGQRAGARANGRRTPVSDAEIDAGLVWVKSEYDRIRGEFLVANK